MASFNMTIDDSSPLISYSPNGAWIDTPDGDMLVSSYTGASFHTTSTQGASATIQFNGTSISFFGGRRPGYGSYSITVDGKSIAEGSAQSDNAVAQQLLGSVSGLPNGLHTAVFSNTGSGSSVDIDAIQLESQIGTSGSLMNLITYDDMDPHITYWPDSAAWGVNSRSDFMNNTLHFTSTEGASASMTFSGDAVAVYGTVSPDHADIEVTLDGILKTLPGGSNGFVRALRTKTLLYYANNLGSQQHNLVFSMGPKHDNTGPFLDLDAITVFSVTDTQLTPPTISPSTLVPTSSSTSSTTHQPSVENIQRSTINKTAIIAGSVGGAIGLFLFLGLFLFFFLRRRRRRGEERDFPTPTTPALPIQRPGMMEAGPRSPSIQWSFAQPTMDGSSSSQHSRDPSAASSYQSSTPILQDVPRNRTASPFHKTGSSAWPIATLPTPVRPSRPPSLDIGDD